MRIGMLNLHYTYENFGAVLVPYSLGIILNRFGHEVILVDFQNAFYLENIKQNNLEKWGDEFEAFRCNFLPERTRKYYDAEELQELDNVIDAYVVGSDQIWRYHSDDGIKAFFLEFASNDKKKMSYAASFGWDGWGGNDSQRERVREALTHFDLITVRESSGIDICKKYFDALATQVLDPTFLLTKAEYEKLIINGMKKEEKHSYLATSILDVDMKTDYIIKTICKKNKLKRKNILGKEHYRPNLSLFKGNLKELIKSVISLKYDSVLFYLKKIILGKIMIRYNSVSDWLKYINEADLVITDSFHCVVFSIIFEKEFYCILNNRGTDRIKGLFRLLCIPEDRIITMKNLSMIDNIKPIEYSAVHEKLSEERVRCINILKTAIEL